ncbi:hypothetical protein EGY16_32795 [Burkholderia pseudomallei]|uniref:capsid assembly protein n=1 Tax=Burkholderia pseudomallei TaxID=28450 RepID=UPI000F4F16F4|nr:hypothetical protein [Burkholderia pseudomallei]AYX32608.1 hypothetical protein EGY16_32795 [Burkholderia pseudomallei]
MTTETTNPNTPANPATPEAPVLVPDSPEYRAAMIAAADASNGVTPPNPAAAAPATGSTEPAVADPNAPTPKLTDPVPGETTKTDPPSTPEKTDGEPVAFDFAKAFDDGSIITEFNAEKPSETLIAGMAKALGISGDQVLQMQAQFRAGQAALTREAEGKLFEAAGGKAQFNEVIAWGQKNLSQDQKVFYEQMLNGPDAASAVSILQQKMQASVDPSLVSVTGRSGGAVAAFRDQSELIAAMADPRYQASQAYRQEVADKLRISRF